MKRIMIIEIDRDQAINLLKQVVEGNEEFMYQTPAEKGGPCLYVYEGEPSCGIGKALALAGVSIELLKEIDERGRAMSIHSLYEKGTEKYGFRLTASADLVFTRFQRMQDGGFSWGSCLEQAVKASGPSRPYGDCD
jgi:hypothetical protein